ncbi:MAG: tRNA (adenosine(37)-N6)-dimethylallyltransferase MiaA [Alphaproteobacteria bacterium]|nr:tRNA (adenosine(37)-N6)-dimethylallyltransferase MiaA [Alphaproteobacteria bacterium]
MHTRAPEPLPFDAVLVAGPTASGKSAAALRLAEEIGGAVVNADSMQIYRELSTLSARPSPEEVARVPHHLFGHVGVREAYSVGRYVQEAAQTLARVRAEGRLPIFCGGTGLYFAALTEGIAEIPTVPQEVRAAVRKRREQLGPAAFHAELVRQDPASARLNPGDRQRTLRAMEVLEASGQPLSFWQQRPAPAVLGGLRLKRVVLAPPRMELYARIDARFVRMMEEGALAEARALEDLDPGLPAAKALGLRPLQDYLAGRCTLPSAVARAQMATRNYAKRQLTWFRHRMVDWLWVTDGNIIITN